jgi:SAM-dependent methyltransferase
MLREPPQQECAMPSVVARIRAALPRKAKDRILSVRDGVARAIGYDRRDWARIVMYDKLEAFMRGFDPRSTRVLAISSRRHFERFNFDHFKTVQFPTFDICRDRLNECFDLIIADQVFEHVKYPYRAARNVHAMLAPGGWFLITTPFLIRYHPEPLDCSRWTRQGMAYFLEESGFAPENIQTFQWGNRQWISAHMRQAPFWPQRGFTGSLRNEEDFPVVVWALAQKEGV